MLPENYVDPLTVITGILDEADKANATALSSTHYERLARISATFGERELDILEKLRDRPTVELLRFAKSMLELANTELTPT